ncbi:MAG: hypothetical protein ABEJ97_08145 [Halobellus sp.]
MTDRGQATLIGFAVAAVVVTTVTVGGVALANDALADADRDPAGTHAAERLAAYLVASDAAHTRGPNVLRAAAVANLTFAEVDAAVPPVRGRAVRVSLGGDVLVARGTLADWPAPRRSVAETRIARRVRVERDEPRTEQITLGTTRAITLDDHTGRAAVTIDPAPGAVVTTVRAGGGVVLHDPDGLDGRYEVSLPPVHPIEVRFEVRSSSPLDGPSTAAVTWTAPTGRTERLEVIVGD